MTEQRLFSNQRLIRLIIPLVIEQALTILVGMCDGVMVSSVGEAAISGVSLVDMINNVILVLFAALTSSIALTESAVSTFQDELGWSRKRSTVLVGVIMVALGTLSSLGYGPLAGVTVIGMQFLDFFDFISNSVLMPIVALLTCILIGHVVGTKVIANEVKEGAGSFHREKLHRVMVRWVAPVMLAAILASELATKVFHLFTI